MVPASIQPIPVTGTLTLMVRGDLYSTYFHKGLHFRCQRIFVFIIIIIIARMFSKHTPLHLSAVIVNHVFVYLMCETISFQVVAQSGGRIAPCTVLSVCLPLL